jgi:hypothetical protein
MNEMTHNRLRAEFEQKISGLTSNITGKLPSADVGLTLLLEFQGRLAANAADDAFLRLSGLALGQRDALLYLDRRLDVLVQAAADTHAEFGLRGLAEQTVEAIVGSFSRRIGELSLQSENGGHA